MIFDPATPKGARALERLERDLIAWLTSVTPAGQPQTLPVWFLWSGGDVLVYGRNGAVRNRNIAANPRVSLHLSDDGVGGDLVILEGEASVDPSIPAIPDNAAYVAKYGDLLRSYGWTPASMSADYDTRIRIRPSRGRTG